MPLALYYITLCSILLPLMASLVRLKKIGDSFYPFLIVIWLGSLNELAGYLIIKRGHSNAIPSNIYSLLEACLIIWFFYKTDSPRYIRKIWMFLLFLFLAGWAFENIFIGRFGVYFNSYFNMFSGFAIVLISINVINEILVKERELLKNSTFLLCIAFIIYFTYRILVEAFWLYGENIGEGFMIKVFNIHSWINLLCNIIFACAILWMQKKKAFTLQYS